MALLARTLDILAGRRPAGLPLATCAPLTQAADLLRAFIKNNKARAFSQERQSQSMAAAAAAARASSPASPVAALLGRPTDAEAPPGRAGRSSTMGASAAVRERLAARISAAACTARAIWATDGPELRGAACASPCW